MSDTINLFQNNRNWETIRRQVLDLVDQEHATGLAQNSALVQRLEQQLAERYNRKHCVTVASCTDALVIALQALNLPVGAPVAVSNYTFTATAHAVARAGYQAVPIDVVKNYCINTDQIKNFAAVVNVDLFGNMANWPALTDLGIPVVNDAAQSLESHNGTAWSVELGDVSCVSFSPSKTISSWGSGGAILTDRDDIAELARQLRLHGKANNDAVAVDPGMNSMISTFEAACVLVGFQHSLRWRQRRRQIAEYLIKESQHATAIDLTLPEHTLHKLVFQSNDRDAVVAEAKQHNVNFAVHYSQLINDEPLYRTRARMLVSNRLKQTSFTVPNQHTLTDEEVETIAKALK